jgi:hypothetical protein
MLFDGIQIESDAQSRAIRNRNITFGIKFPLVLHDVINERRSRQVFNQIGMLRRRGQLQIGREA